MNILYDILGVPFGYVMRLIYHLVQNYGIAIILFTLFSKALLFPINYKTQKSSVKMQRLNPKLKELRKKYEKDLNFLYFCRKIRQYDTRFLLNYMEKYNQLKYF